MGNLMKNWEREMNSKDKKKGIIIDVLGDICLAQYELDMEACCDVADAINDRLGKADYRIANLESPFLEDKNVRPIYKAGPNLRTDMKYVDFINKLDIDAYTLANNHLGDFGEKGIKDTINILKKMKKQYTGSSLDYESTYSPLRVEIEGFKVSFISVCETEFGVARNGKIGAAGFDNAIIKEIIQKEKEWADYKIIIFHGGTEYYPFPSPGLKQRYHWLIDIGGDIVIGMHQHCPVGYERYRDSLIIFGLGNFFFPERNITLYENWNVGYMARLLIESNKTVHFQPIPFMFDNEGKTFQRIDTQAFTKYYTEISEPIQNDAALKKLFNGWAYYSGVKQYEILKKHIANDDNIYSASIVKNLFTCEAHNELLRTWLNLRYYEPYENYEEDFEAVRKYINILHYGLRTEEDKSFETKKEEKYVLWGVSKKAEEIYKKLKDSRYEIFLIDKNPNKQGFSFMGIIIESPEAVISRNIDATYYICTSEMYVEEIRDYLISLGVSEQKIRREWRTDDNISGTEKS